MFFEGAVVTGKEANEAIAEARRTTRINTKLEVIEFLTELRRPLENKTDVVNSTVDAVLQEVIAELEKP